MTLSIIPYDPRLELGMIPTPQYLKYIEEVAALRKPIEFVQDKISALIQQKNSLLTTMDELISLGIDQGEIQELKNNIAVISEDIIHQTEEYHQMIPTYQEAISKLAVKQASINLFKQGPVDFAQSKLTALPLKKESTKIDVQYFSFQAKNEDALNASNQSFSDLLKNKLTPYLGLLSEKKIATYINQVIAQSKKNHKLASTTVISIVHTHDQVQIFNPLILDPDKAIKNYMAYTQKPWDGLDNPEEMLKKATTTIGDPEKEMPVIAGVSYGSSFIGLINYEPKDLNVNEQVALNAARSVNSMIAANLSIFPNPVEEIIPAIENSLNHAGIQTYCNVIPFGVQSTNKLPQATDMFSMMTTLNHFITKKGKTNGSIPITFYLKYITEKTIALQWLEKYYPHLLRK